MTVLICGMSRAGNTFLSKLFENYGDEFDPKLFFKYSQIGSEEMHYALNEPQSISDSMRKGEHDKLDGLIENIKEKNKNKHQLVIVSQPLIFANHDLIQKHFDTIIICIRKSKKAWIKSALSHGAQGYLIERPKWLPDRVKTIEELYDFWLFQSVKFFTDISSKALANLYTMGDDKCFRKILDFYNFQNLKIKHDDFPHWRGSRFEVFK